MCPRDKDDAGLKAKHRRRGIAYGMAIFFSLGVVLSLVTGNHALTGAGVALGLTLGVAFGELIYRREKSKGHLE